MFDSLGDEKLRAAYDAAQLLYDDRRALGRDLLAVELGTLRVDLAVELENRGKPPARPAGGRLPPAEAHHAPARDQPACPEMRRNTIAMTSASRLAGATAPRRPEHAGTQATLPLRAPGAHGPSFPAPRRKPGTPPGPETMRRIAAALKWL